MQDQPNAVVEVDAAAISGPCLVGRHDRCRGVVRHVFEDAPCECPVCEHEAAA
jgi:hypothetical protein